MWQSSKKEAQDLSKFLKLITDTVFAVNVLNLLKTGRCVLGSQSSH